jgi:hypothetical protein
MLRQERRCYAARLQNNRYDASGGGLQQYPSRQCEGFHGHVEFRYLTPSWGWRRPRAVFFRVRCNLDLAVFPDLTAAAFFWICTPTM